MNRVLTLALFIGLFWSTAASAQKSSGSVTIKLKRGGESEVALIAHSETGSWKVKVEDSMGNVLVDKADTTSEISAYKETILKREGTKLASKLEREYTRFQIKKEGKTEGAELKGKTVVFDKKGDKYVFVYKDGKEVTGRVAELLAEQMEGEAKSDVDMNAFMLPKNPVDIGDSWKLDMEAFAKEVVNRTKGGSDVVCDANKASGTAKLLKSYRKAGRQFGEIHYQISLPVKSTGKGEKEMKFNDGAKLTIEAKLDVCIDGSSVAGSATIKRTLSGTATLRQAPGSVVTISSETVAETTQAEPVKK